jgi:hypothetical protein
VLQKMVVGTVYINIMLNANYNYMITGQHLRHLLAFLNSNLILYYLVTINQRLDKNDWRWFTHCVEKLPIPQIEEPRRTPYETLANYVLLITENNLKHQSAYFEQLIDGLVYELYFPDEIKVAGKEILTHLGDLPLFTDTQSTEEKLAVIQAEFDRLYDPHHPVRNHLETLDSIEVVRAIREALER